MDTLDEMKEKWARHKHAGQPYDPNNMLRVIRQRVRKHTRESMKYFWASFALQLLVYALYAHVVVRFLHDPVTVTFAIVGVLLFIPFTYMLLRKFKQLAVLRPDGNETSSVRQYITQQRNVLYDFFRFKLRYELWLIPLSTLVGTLLVFKIYVPGGPLAYLNGVWITMGLTLASCYLAIRNENRKSFRKPLAELDNLLREFAEENIE
ncbi:MAG TPA: hypothetical protein VK658_29265 [Chryseolinea sp.]|nr:hypothetical protein [Chryseolinea sp.]